MKNFFSYHVIDHDGATSRGVAQLPYADSVEVITYLEQKGYTVLSVAQLGRFSSMVLRILSGARKKKVQRKEVSEFLSNLSVILRSGLPLMTGLQESITEAENPTLVETIEGVIQRVEGGIGFAEAASAYPEVFSNTVIYLIRLGEETGQLDRTIKDAALHLKKIDRIVTETKQALIYPGFVFLTLTMATIFWFYAVVPKIVMLFRGMNVELPAITLTLMSISEFIQAYLLQMVMVGFVVILVLRELIRKHRPVRRLYHAFLLKLPVAGVIVNASTLAFISEYFSLLLNSGIDLLKALEILSNSVANEVFREKIDIVRQELQNGSGVAAGFRRANVFSAFLIRMISVGEQSGTLPEQLRFVAEEYSTRLSDIVTNIGKMIEPLVLMLAGAIFAVIGGGLFLPIYDLIGKVQ